MTGRHGYRIAPPSRAPLSKAGRLAPVRPGARRAAWRSIALRFARDRRGAVAVLVAAGVVVLTAAVGLATDAARGYIVKARLSQALDAAGIAGARVMFSPTRDADIRMYFDANFPPGFMGATVTGPSFVVSPDNEILTLEASVRIGTTFMQVLGIDTMTVSAATEITRQTQLLDVVLAIDMSGSMASGAGGGSTRIQAARAAATELVTILFGDDGIKDLLNIGLVPWNGKVKVTLNGVPFDSALTTTEAVSAFTNPLTGAAQSVVYRPNNSPVPLLTPPAANWKGCVYSRFLDNGQPDDDADILFGDLSGPSGDWVAWQPIGPEGEPVPGSAICTSAVGGSECRECLSHGITPLQNTKAAIQAAIDELISPTGTTNITQGLGWAWRVLMPEAPFTEAEANPEGDRQQAIVLLTDGENYGGSGDGYKATFGLGGAAGPEMDDRLRQLAANIKAAGVVIYAIQFANSGGALQALMKEIASGPNAPFYHYAPDAATLQQVFREVANNLSELRISR